MNVGTSSPSRPKTDGRGLEVSDEFHVRPSSKRFRFKGESLRKDSQQRHIRSRSPHRLHGGKRHHHRRRPTASPTGPKDLSPDRAFRESLFDALGDDEGAAYWEGVYGQPIHGYSYNHQNEDNGVLERMTDEEYVTFVRRKMWERSREGVEAIRQARKAQQREEENARRKTRRDTADKGKLGARDSFEKDIEASVIREQERRTGRHWRERWQAYLQSWTDLNALVDQFSDETLDVSTRGVSLGDKIFWPVESGKRADVSEEQIESFMKNCSSQSPVHPDDLNGRLDVLKTERIRWHPDKIQQRYGAINLDERTQRGATQVFQILDKLWTRMKV